uniref:Uncharacterized protein n=1 Tax=Glossina pallidipes TaxID=7398 RepID=A0A1A9ZLK9_GLOPL
MPFSADIVGLCHTISYRLLLVLLIGGLLSYALYSQLLIYSMANWSDFALLIKQEVNRVENDSSSKQVIVQESQQTLSSFLVKAYQQEDIDISGHPERFLQKADSTDASHIVKTSYHFPNQQTSRAIEEGGKGDRRLSTFDLKAFKRQILEQYFTCGCLPCGLVVRASGKQPEDPGSIPGVADP